MTDRLKNLIPVIPAAALLGVAAWLFCVPASPLPFTAGTLAKERTGIETRRTELEKLRTENRRLRNELRPLERMRASALSLPPEKVRFALVERMERAAAESGMAFRSMSDVQTVPVAKGVESYLLTVSSGCTITELEALLKNATGGKPRLYWKSLRLRPSSPGTPELLQLDGQLAALNFLPEKDGE